MASSEKSKEDSSEIFSPEELIEEAVEHITKEEYKSAYDKLAKNMDRKITDTRKTSYRDERVIANILETEIAELLSELATEEPYYSAGSLDNSKERLNVFAKEYSTK